MKYKTVTVCPDSSERPWNDGNFHKNSKKFNGGTAVLSAAGVSWIEMIYNGKIVYGKGDQPV
ncbi:hypothetical protein C6Y45_07235 [Alkalicoccus saliphilus]|uniref:Uncharacterized protein n=1 Tax=Alkalicoccus saliphilus TaxID=200989 RepID=A0A2T4U702_9BACI|nr:hypothetical protein C6Y45_07235 [Alkalicoccus saliphilus]